MAVVQMQRQDWRDRLQMSGSGAFKANLHNAAIALRHAPELADTIRYDEFGGRVMALGALPWSGRVGREWTDHDSRALTEWMQARHLGVGRPIVEDAVELVAQDAPYHPVRGWLSQLEWDGERRLDFWLASYLGVPYGVDRHAGEDNRPYVRAVGSKWMISAVARVMEPGSKVDTALILEGRQGRGKSTAARILCGDEWFADQISDFSSKDSAQDLRGKWIIELGELSHFGQAAIEKIKAFMSRQVDHYRPTFGRRSVDVPRQSVFIGSTNRDDYLQDDENRRFWPVTTSDIDLKALARDREQLWAEAVVRYRDGERWHLEGDVIELAKRQQADRVQADPWHSIVMDWLGRQPTDDHAIHEILRGALGMREPDMTQREMNRIARILRIEGWQRVKCRAGKSTTWAYRRPDVPSVPS